MDALRLQSGTGGARRPTQLDQRNARSTTAATVAAIRAAAPWRGWIALSEMERQVERVWKSTAVLDGTGAAEASVDVACAVGWIASCCVTHSVSC